MFKGRHFDQSVILLCVRWYLAYGLSLRDLKEMMAERGIGVDHSTIHRWTVHFSPLLLQRFNQRKRPVTCRLQSASSQRRWLGTAGPNASSSTAVRPIERPSSPATRQADCRIALGARWSPSGSARADTSTIASSRIIDASSAVCGPCSVSNHSQARTTLDGIEMIHMMRKRQARYAYNANPSIAEQFEILAAA